MNTLFPAWRLLKARGQFLKNQIVHPSKDKFLRWSLISVLSFLFVIGDYAFFYRIIDYLDGLPLEVGEELIVQLINVIFLTLFAMVLFSSVISSLSIYYVSSDLDFLHSLPIPRISIVHLRLVQTLINSSWMMLLFASPIFVAYGYFFDANLGYYFYLCLAFIPFVVIPCLLGIMGIMVLMRYFPTDKAHQVLSFLGLFFLVGLVMFLRFLSPEKFFGKNVSDEMIMAFVENLKMPEYPFLPSSWMTQGVTGWVAGNYDAAWWELGWLSGATVILLVLFRIISGQLYFTGWRTYQEVKNAPKNKKRDVSRFGFWENLPWSRSKKALFVKDIKIFSRDPSQWSQMFVLAALVIVYIFNIMNLPLSNLVLKNVVSVLNIGLIGFVLSALIARFVFSSTSIEGRKMWAIYTSPVDMHQFLMTKFWMYCPPLLVIGELLVVVSNYLLEVDPYVMRVSVLGVLLITIGLVGMGVGMGAMYPVFKYENVSEISSGTGGILFMISSLTYVGLVLMLGAWPMHVHFKQKFLFESIGGVEVPVFYGAIVLLSLLVAWVPMKRGIRALREMDI